MNEHKVKRDPEGTRRRIRDAAMQQFSTHGLAGARVAKHSNRGVSSKSGSADVLEALGVAIDLSPASVARCLDETGIGFMFAPNHHPAMKVFAGQDLPELVKEPTTRQLVQYAGAQGDFYEIHYDQAYAKVASQLNHLAHHIEDVLRPRRRFCREARS